MRYARSVVTHRPHVLANQSLQLPGRPSRGGAATARSAAFGGTLLAPVVSLLAWRGVVVGGPQLSFLR